MESISKSFINTSQLISTHSNNQALALNDDFGILKKTCEFTEAINLLPSHEILTLEFSSLDYTAPDRNKYRYQMIGVNDTWVEAGNQRSATFLQLSPQEYTFRVQGANSHGIWSDI